MDKLADPMCKKFQEIRMKPVGWRWGNGTFKADGMREKNLDIGFNVQ